MTSRLFTLYTLLFVSLPGLATAVEFPFSKDSFKDGKLQEWSLARVRKHRDDTIGNLRNSSGQEISGPEKDAAAIPSMLATRSETPKEIKEFNTVVDLTDTTGFVFLAIHVDDNADLTVTEIDDAGEPIGTPIPFNIKGSALWRAEKSYKEFPDPIPAGKKYKFYLKYENTVNLTKQYNGLIDHDGANVFLIYQPYDLDIVHPATGELAESNEDSGDGGYVSVQRLENNVDVTPKTKLIIHKIPSAQTGWKTRLKFENSSRYKVFLDSARTKELISETTELPADVDTTLWLHGLVKSPTRGSESLTLQVYRNSEWTDSDSVKFTLVQSEFLFQVKAFIPYAWTEAEEEVPGPNGLSPMAGKVAKGDLHSLSGSRINGRPASPGFVNAYSTDREPNGTPGDPTYDLFDNAPFRVCQQVIITPYEELHGSVDKATDRALMTAPLSEHYDKTTGVDSAELKLKMGYIDLKPAGFLKSGKPPANTPSYEKLSRKNKVAVMTIDGGGKDGAMPWGTTWATDDIHWRLYLKVWCDTDPLNPKVEFGGVHDSYPAYEIIVIQSDGSYKDIHRVSPKAGTMPGPHSLDPEQEIKVGRIDTITK